VFGLLCINRIKKNVFKLKGIAIMTVQHYIVVIAGFFISRWALAFTAFVGVNLFQYGFTHVCPLGFVLKKLGVPESKIGCVN
jgi:hypothetical protein